MPVLDQDSFAFLSHSGKNKRFTRQLAAGLAAYGVSVWFDEWRVEPGESIPARIEEGFKRCSHFVLLWSKAASVSSYVTRERQSFLHRAITEGKKVVPVLLDDTPLPPLLADVLDIRARRVVDALDALVGPGRDEREIREAIVALGARREELLGRGVGPGESRCTSCGSNNVVHSGGSHGDQYIDIWTCGDCGEHLGDILG